MDLPSPQGPREAALIDALLSTGKALEGTVLPGGLHGRADPALAREALGNLLRRLEEGPRAPLRVAVFGPTGAGKSKLFNAILREARSPSSFRRPFTRRPVYLLHRRRSALRLPAEAEPSLHDRPEWEDTVLIDAPDFDSVEGENRAAAAAIYAEADAFVFVADVHKYADASVWSYLERLRDEKKRAVFVLNKVSGSAAPLEDFRRRLEDLFRERGLPGPLVAVEERPGGDEELLPEEDAGLRQVGEWLRALRASRPEALRESLRLDLARLLAVWDRLAGPVREYREGLDRLRAALDARLERARKDLERDLQAEIDPALKTELYREVLRRVERMDLLRYPRRLLALPAIGLKMALGSLWPRLFAGGAAARGDEAAEASNLAALEARVRELSEETERSFLSEPACPGLLDPFLARSLEIDHAALRERHREVSAGFRAWVEEQAKSTAATLTTEHKLMFVLSQVIYNTVVIGIQVKTAGTLTLSEMLTDGVLSPLVAKAVGMAVSNERVLDFENEARREHARRLGAVLGEARDRFAGRLDSHQAALEPLLAAAPRVEALRAGESVLLDLHRRGGG